MEHNGKEGLYVLLVSEVLVEVKELVPRSTDENFCLLRFCRHGLGEVDLGPKARGG